MKYEIPARSSFLVVTAIIALLFFSPLQPLKASDKNDSEDTPVTHDAIYDDLIWSGSRSWRAPSYAGQDSAIGYNKQTFSTPAGMEKQVQFWIDIYSKYTTTQGVLHDSEQIDFIYSVVDFSDVEKLSGLTLKTKEKLKQKIVEEEKKKIIQRLEKVAAAKSISDVDKKDREIFKMRDQLSAKTLRFQLGQKDRMQKAIFISGRYIEDFENIFREQNLPIELTRLVFVESSFNVLARSKVGASGLWQIMPSTARPYRLINQVVDRRNHPIDATKLSARFMRMNYNQLESWPLAITGYNHGPTGVLKMTRKYKTREIADLIENVKSRRSFGFASRNFYASFLAALHVEKNASQYFPGIKWSQKLDSDPIKLPVAISYKELLSWFAGDKIKLQVFNPHLTQNVLSGKKSITSGVWIQLPQEKYPQVLAQLARKKREEIRLRKTASIK